MNIKRQGTLFVVFASTLIFSCSEKRNQIPQIRNEYHARLASYQKNPRSFNEAAAWDAIQAQIDLSGVESAAVAAFAKVSEQPEDDRLLLLSYIEAVHLMAPLYLSALIDQAADDSDVEKIRFALRVLASRLDLELIVQSPEIQASLKKLKFQLPQFSEPAIESSLKSLEAGQSKSGRPKGKNHTRLHSKEDQLGDFYCEARGPSLEDRMDYTYKPTRKDRIRACQQDATQKIAQIQTKIASFDLGYAHQAKRIVELRLNESKKTGAQSRELEVLSVLRESRAKQVAIAASSLRFINTLSKLLETLEVLDDGVTLTALASEIENFLAEMGDRSYLAEAKILRLISKSKSNKEVAEMRSVLGLLQSLGLSHAIYLRNNALSGQESALLLMNDPKIAADRSDFDSLKQRLKVIGQMTKKVQQCAEVIHQTLIDIRQQIELETAIKNRAETEVLSLENDMNDLNQGLSKQVQSLAQLQSLIAAEMFIMRDFQEKIRIAKQVEIPAWQNRRRSICPKVK